MPYWKVPYSNRKSPEGYALDATIEEVQAALPSDIDGLIVNESLRYPCVRFPDGTSNEMMQKVKKHLENQGFEVS